MLEYWDKINKKIMKKYCLVKDKQIIEGPTELPTTAYNVSNFHMAGDTFVREYGWLPVETQTEGKEVFVSSSFEILEDKIINRVLTRDKTPEEINEEKWKDIRIKRDSLLSDSDKLTLSDRWEKLNLEQKQKLSEYRQLLRDIPNKYPTPDSVIFPTL